MLDVRIPLGEYVEAIVDFLLDNFGFIFDLIDDGVYASVMGIEGVLESIPWYVFTLVVAAIAFKVSGRGVAIFTIIGFYLLHNLNLWTPAIQTLALVLTAEIITLVLGLPLGILVAKKQTLDNIVRPVLDFMQTMPAFVYLIPAVMFFSLGRVPGIMATIIFSMPPMIRLTSLGIKQVPEDLVEAGHAFGVTPSQLLMKVELPHALPTIMAGVNQSIMLGLSMVVIAAMIGAGGLGSMVLRGVQRVDIGMGFESGLAVVILAIFLDRVTQSLGTKS